MTNHTSTPTPTLDQLADDDPRRPFAIAVRTARAVVDGVRADQLDDATPCPEYTVRDLLGHLHGALARAAAVGRGEDPMSVTTEPPFAPVGDWPYAFLDAAHSVRDAWSDAANLERTIQMPWATMPAPVFLGIYTNEITVHTWDLARATGQDPVWDESVLQVAYDTMVPGLPAEGRTPGMVPFADVVPVDRGAPLIDRLVAWNGRRP